jgi:hypothetical protein
LCDFFSLHIVVLFFARVSVFLFAHYCSLLCVHIVTILFAFLPCVVISQISLY